LKTGSHNAKPDSVHVISKNAWRDAVAADPTLAPAMAAWHKVATSAAWDSLVDVRRVYPHADFVDPYTVFNIKGNAYRLIVKIEYRWRMIFVKDLISHREYARGDWKR
jgi:mRNA interferase HigB